LWSRKEWPRSSRPAASIQGQASPRPEAMSCCFVIFNAFLCSLIAALATCSLPAAWQHSSEGMFFLATASCDENDNDDESKKDNCRGVVKLRVMSAEQLLSAGADDRVKQRASSVVCSLVCEKRYVGPGLDKHLTLCMCEGVDLDDSSKRAVYVVASIYGGFNAWCISADHFSSMSKGPIKIFAFK
jgi:hypothetical protein